MTEHKNINSQAESLQLLRNTRSVLTTELCWPSIYSEVIEFNSWQKVITPLVKKTRTKIAVGHYINTRVVVVVQSLSCVWLFATPWTAAHQASLSFMVSQSLLKLLSIVSVMLSNHLILCLPFLLLPSIFPSNKVFSNELALCIRWPKYWSFSSSPSNEYSGLISIRIYWFDLSAAQGILKSLP